MTMIVIVIHLIQFYAKTFLFNFNIIARRRQRKQKSKIVAATRNATHDARFVGAHFSGRIRNVEKVGDAAAY